MTVNEKLMLQTLKDSHLKLNKWIRFFHFKRISLLDFKAIKDVRDDIAQTIETIENAHIQG